MIYLHTLCIVNTPAQHVHNLHVHLPTSFLTVTQQCPRYLIVDGNGGWNAGVARRTMRWAAGSEQFAATFCCDQSSDCASTFNAPNTEYTVDGQSVYCPVYAERGESIVIRVLIHYSNHCRWSSRSNRRRERASVVGCFKLRK